MTVAIGSVVLLLASVLLGGVLLLAVFGIIVWLSYRQRQMQAESQGPVWEHNSADIAAQGDTSIVVPGK